MSWACLNRIAGKTGVPPDALADPDACRSVFEDRSFCCLGLAGLVNGVSASKIARQKDAPLRHGNNSLGSFRPVVSSEAEADSNRGSGSLALFQPMPDATLSPVVWPVFATFLTISLCHFRQSSTAFVDYANQLLLHTQDCLAGIDPFPTHPKYHSITHSVLANLLRFTLKVTPELASRMLKQVAEQSSALLQPSAVLAPHAVIARDRRSVYHTAEVLGLLPQAIQRAKAVKAKLSEIGSPSSSVQVYSSAHGAVVTGEVEDSNDWTAIDHVAIPIGKTNEDDDNDTGFHDMLRHQGRPKEAARRLSKLATPSDASSRGTNAYGVADIMDALLGEGAKASDRQSTTTSPATTPASPVRLPFQFPEVRPLAPGGLLRMASSFCLLGLRTPSVSVSLVADTLSKVLELAGIPTSFTSTTVSQAEVAQSWDRQGTEEILMMAFRFLHSVVSLYTAQNQKKNSCGQAVKEEKKEEDTGEEEQKETAHEADAAESLTPILLECAKKLCEMANQACARRSGGSWESRAASIAQTLLRAAKFIERLIAKSPYPAVKALQQSLGEATNHPYMKALHTVSKRHTLSLYDMLFVSCSHC